MKTRKQDVHGELARRLNALKQAGMHQVGEKLAYKSNGETRSRAQVEAQYKHKQRRREQHRKRYPGW